MRLNANARNAIPSQSFSFKRKCLVASARESLRETLRSSEIFYFAVARVKAPIRIHASTPSMYYYYHLLLCIISMFIIYDIRMAPLWLGQPSSDGTSCANSASTLGLGAVRHSRRRLLDIYNCMYVCVYIYIYIYRYCYSTDYSQRAGWLHLPGQLSIFTTTS